MCLRNAINNSQQNRFILDLNIGDVDFVEHSHKHHFKNTSDKGFNCELMMVLMR